MAAGIEHFPPTVTNMNFRIVKSTAAAILASLMATSAMGAVVMPPAQYRKPCPADFPVYEFSYWDVNRQCRMWGRSNAGSHRIESCTVMHNGVAIFRIMPRVDDWNITASYRADLDVHECAIVNGWDDR